MTRRNPGSYDYGAISGVVEQSEATCRRHFSRARRHLEAGRQRFEASTRRRDGVSLQATHANGEPALLTVGPDGAVLGVRSIEVGPGGTIVGLRNQINPDQLHHLARVGDLNALMSVTRPGVDASASTGHAPRRAPSPPTAARPRPPSLSPRRR